MATYSKFANLQDYLLSCTQERLTLSFEKIEQLINQPLCQSAYKYKAYWQADKSHVLPNLIIESGYHVDSVDLNNKIVYLVKIHEN